jgi:hypothetical protein
MRNNRDHLGIRFEVWSGEWTWFWRAFNTGRNRGAVGAAATEAGAVCEAHTAIEEMSAWSPDDTSSSPLFDCRVYTSVVRREKHPEIWTIDLERLAEYVATV